MQHNILYIISIFGFVSVLLSCGDKAKQNPVDEFIIKDGFQIEQIAAEPLLNSPMAMSLDLRGRMWVVELPGYMRDINGSDEEKADGKVIILEDTAGDGIMDNRKIFLDNLVLPRAISLVYGGLLYTEGTKLWWTSIENDQPREKVLVDSLYVIGGNIEHQPNGLFYNLDNWIYSAKSFARYQRKNGQWIKEATTHRGQWGICSDDEGRLFYNNNSTALVVDFTTPNQLIQNPYMRPQEGLAQVLDPERRVYPYQATPVNRGYNKGILDEENKLKRFTSACGPMVYRGTQFPEEFHGNYFLCGPEANLVKRYIMKEEGAVLTAKQAYTGSEFLVSKEQTFRPVNLYNGFDGAMYIVDLRKGVIQHRAYMSNYLREKTLESGLEKVTGIGRIYKVSSTEKSLEKVPDFSQFKPLDFVKLLQNPSGRLRSVAQQQLVFNESINLKNEIAQIANDNTSPFGQIHALWTMEALDLLDVKVLLEVNRNSESPMVFTHLLQLAESYKTYETSLFPLYEKAVALNSPKSDLQLIHTLAHLDSKECEAHLENLLKKYHDDKLYAEAFISGATGKEEKWLSRLSSNYPNSVTIELLKETISNRENNISKKPQLRTATFQDNRTKGASLYTKYCATCHGQDANGMDGLGPPLYESEYVTESAEKLILIALHGMQGPITVRGKLYDNGTIMPGLKNNPELDDEAMAALLRFIGNGFTSGAKSISTGLVKEIRAKTADREEMFTAESLEDWLVENGAVKMEN